MKYFMKPIKSSARAEGGRGRGGGRGGRGGGEGGDASRDGLGAPDPADLGLPVIPEDEMR